jgi:hypothetical protein
VSFLMPGQPKAAVPHLERARTHASAEFVEEIDWRLGLAFVHAGDLDRARDPFKRVCDGGNVYRDRACRAGELLASRR